MSHGDEPKVPTSNSDDWFAFAILACGLVVVCSWVGAQLASVLSSRRVLSVSLGDAFGALVRLPQNLERPALAWPEPASSQLPGPVLYWASTVFVTVAVFWLAIRVIRRLFVKRIGTVKRERLGVSPKARMAKSKDLRTIVVDGPTKGRFILGTVDNRLVATENRAGAPTTAVGSRTPVARQGDRSAVAVIGPQRSGKTVNVISGILEWEGPAILSSVRDDLFERTVKARQRMGEVFVFDPLESLGELPEGVHRVGWSPLQVAGSVSGAMEAASVLMEAAPMEGTTNANYWSKKGEALLWPVLYAAAMGERTMADVVRWLAVQDGTELETPVGGGDPRPGGEIRRILHALISDSSREADRIQAQHALAQFDGFWKLDTRTRSDIYSTSQTLVQPWEDPRVSFASSPAIGPEIDLKSLLVGRNTLFVVQPLKSTQRFSVVFGGLLGSLVKDQAYETAHRYGAPLPDLLVVIDEAGNTPLQWLPGVASTCSGIGVLLVTVWQSKAQIDAIYQKQSDPLLTNHGSKIFFAGASDEATLRYVSYLAGEEEIHQRSANSDVGGQSRRSLGDSTTHRHLIPGELLRQVVPGEALLIHGTLPPAHLKSRRYWIDPHLVNLAEGKAKTLPEWPVPDALTAALDFDPTPSAEILAHLPDYSPATTTHQVNPTPLKHSAKQPQPLGWGSK